MSFKYINPGYGYLVTPDFKTVRSTLRSPRFGVSFWRKAEYGWYEGYTIPALGYDGTLYFKFDVYIPNEEFYGVVFGLGDGDYDKAIFILEYIPSWAHFLTCLDGDNGTILSVDSSTFGDFLQFDAVNTIWGRIRIEGKYDNDAEITIKINGNTVGECTGVYTGASHETMFVINNSEKTPISNFIISDEEIDIDENIFRINGRSTGTWYMAYAIDGTAYRTFKKDPMDVKNPSWGEVSQDELNPRALYDVVGGKDEKILTMLAVAEPAFYTGSEVAAQYFSNTETSKAHCFVVVGKGDSYNKESYPWQNISSDTSAALIQYLPVTSDTTFASINGWDVGWRVDLGSV